MTKAELRNQARARRRAADPADRDRRSRGICERVERLDWFETARALALYWPMLDRGEVDVRPLHEIARASGKRVYYPTLRRAGETVERSFRRADDSRELRPRSWPFAEPDPEAPEAGPDELDFILVPALGADRRGHRIGYGSGYYDVVLSSLGAATRSLVVVYAFELVDRLPVGSLDHPCDAVLTDQHLVIPG